MRQVRAGMLAILMLLCSLFGQAQQSGATAADAMVPPLVDLSGMLTAENSKPLSGVLGVTYTFISNRRCPALAGDAY